MSQCDGSQGVLLGYMGPALANNTVTQNIIVSEATERSVSISLPAHFLGHCRGCHDHSSQFDREQIAFIHATHHAPGGFANGTRGSTFDSNLYAYSAE